MRGGSGYAIHGRVCRRYLEPVTSSLRLALGMPGAKFGRSSYRGISTCNYRRTVRDSIKIRIKIRFSNPALTRSYGNTATDAAESNHIFWCSYTHAAEACDSRFGRIRGIPFFYTLCFLYVILYILYTFYTLYFFTRYNFHTFHTLYPSPSAHQQVCPPV